MIGDRTMDLIIGAAVEAEGPVGMQRAVGAPWQVTQPSPGMWCPECDPQ